MHGIKMSRTRTAKTRFKSVLAWLRHVSALRESSDVGRQKISRKRRSCPDSHLVRLPGGRPRDGNVQRASLDRNKRRWAVRAVQLLPLVAQELVRLRVVAKSSLAAASDVRRALRLLVLLFFVPDFGPADGPTRRRIFPGSEKGPVPARRCMHGDVCSAVATSLQELELDVLTLNVMNRVAIRHVPSGT